MEAIYLNPEAAGSFGSPSILHRYSNDSIDKVKKWLESQDSYTLHRNVKRRFTRRQTFAVGIDHVWQMDLADMTLISRHNDNYKYILTCIDVFSRYAFAVPVRNKTAIEIKNAFEEILSRNDRRPTYVQIDKGREFVNAIFSSFLNSQNILHYTSENDDIKCALVERFNRTLKSKMWRYFTLTKNMRYLDALPKLVLSYNKTYHSTIKMSPEEVTVHNEAELRERLYRPYKKPVYKFDVGDKVRISKNVSKFQKGYEGGWSKEVFVVKDCHPTNPPTYQLRDYSGEDIKGKFYAQELQKVDKETNVFEVEKVLRTRKVNGRKQYLVRWMGYGPKHDSWVDDIIV